MNIEIISNENIEMLWEIIYDDIKSELKTREKSLNIQKFFLDNLRSFFEREKSTSLNLIELNKKFILDIVPKIKDNLNSIRVDDACYVTVEERHNERKSEFEKNLEEKRKQFNDTMLVPVPETPKFSDKLDEPIGSAMDQLIAKTLAQRNYDLEQIHTTINKADVEKFLKPVETSIKLDKLQNEKINNQQYKYLYQEKPKLIQIGEEINNENLITKKQISWGENTSVEFNEIQLNNNEVLNKDSTENVKVENKSINIFSKLKPIKPEDSLDMFDVKLEIKNINAKIEGLTEKIDKLMHLYENKIEK